uniref:Uncharacterized protein n=1 Tax=Anguilla anguilla TaxID=7936 RepID=A0A0E9VNA1_ANGAN
MLFERSTISVHPSLAEMFNI